MRTALFGLSGFGALHYRVLTEAHARGEVSLDAAVVINPDEVRERCEVLRSLGCRIYASSGEFWEKERGRIDLTFIPTSIASHAPLSIEAMENGSHVYVEKPFTGTLQEADACIETARRTGRQLFVGFQDLYNPQNRRVKEMALRGDFGRIRTIKGWGSWPRPLSYFRRNGWAGRLRAGDGWTLDSPLNNAMAHFFVLMLYWAGATPSTLATPRRITGDLFRVQDIESFDTASLRVDTEEGPEIFYAISHSGENNLAPYLYLEGEDGWLEWVHADGMRWESRHGQGEDPDVLQGGALHEIVLKEVLQALEGGTGAWGVAPEEARKHVLCVNALHEHFPIRGNLGSLTREKERKGDVFRFVPGMEENLKTAFEKEELLGNLLDRYDGEPPSSVDLAAYTAFSPAETAAT